MSDFENQYNSPETSVNPDKSQIIGNLTEPMFKHLKESSLWLRFVGIIGFIGCGLIVVGGLLPSIGIMSHSGLSGILGTSDFPTWIIWLLLPLNLAGAALFFFPSFFTWKFGDCIRKYEFSNKEEDLEKAFKNNKSLWKFYGILIIVYLSIIPFTIILTIIFGIAVAARTL